MNRMIYNLKQVIIESKKKKLYFLLIFTTLFFGLISSFYGFFHIKASLSNPKNQNDEYTRSFEFRINQNSFLTLKDIEKIKADNINIEKLYRSSLAYCSINIGNEILNAFTVNIIDFEALYNNKNYNLQENIFDGEYSCFISENFLNTYMKQAEKDVVGKSIIINGTNYKIAGVISAEYLMQNIWLPATIFLDELGNKCETKYTVTLKDSNDFEHNLNSFTDYIESTYNISIKTLSGTFIKQSNKSGASIFLIQMFLIIIGLLIYALINIFNLIYNKLQDERKTIAIKLSLGATKRKIFFQFFSELFIISFLSSIAVISTLKITTIIFKYNKIIYNYVPVDFTLFIFTIVLSTFVAFILSFNAIRSISKKSIIEIINVN